MKTYTPRKWDLSGLEGISDATLEMHFGLYEGYVKNTNTLIEQTSGSAGAGPQFAEPRRRLNWEFCGMRLHEYYFDNLTRGAREPGSGGLHDLLGESYGGFDAWKKDFFAVGGMRGVGWAIAYYDTTARQIVNVWVEQHQNGNLPGLIPIVVMDCWEHAFIKDYKPSERGKYIEAFYANLNWQACEGRLAQARSEAGAMAAR
jgi:Fe-Mn family superoxide dismutase